MGRRKRSDLTKFSESLREDYPLFFAFGGDIEFLTIDQQSLATIEKRIKSVWPYLVSEVRRFERSLRPRDKANFDAEDMLLEIIIILHEKDRRFDPSRGSYITFAGSIIRKEFLAFRDRAKTVQAPRNSIVRLKNYEENESISDRQSCTLGKLKNVLAEQQTIEDSFSLGSQLPSGSTQASRDEMKHIAQEVMRASLKVLTTEEVEVIGRSFGLWGQEVRLSDLSEMYTDKDPDHFKRVKFRALAKIREELVARGHRLTPEGEDAA